MNKYTKKMVLLISSALIPFLSTSQSQYCMLPGRTPYAPQQPGITNFALNKVTRSSNNVENITSVVVTTGLTDSLMIGKVYTLTLTHTEDAVNFPGARNNIRMYIDYNNDFDFTDPGETVISKDFIPSGVFTATFSVPASAFESFYFGTTGLRVTAKMSADVGHTIPTPCDIPADPLGYHGEMEDYLIYIMAADPPPNTVGVSQIQGLSFNSEIYPNPANEQFFLKLNLNKPVKISVDLFDLTGKKIKTFMSEKEFNPAQEELNFDLSKVEAGAYFIKITGGNNSSYHKIIKTEN